MSLPNEAWLGDWYAGSHQSSRKPKYTKLVVRLMKALSSHLDSGTFWEKHCSRAAAKAGFAAIPNWPSCFFREKLKLFLVVYVDDFKMSGPGTT